MDDMQEIEKKMQEIQVREEAPAPSPVPSDTHVSVALETAAQTIVHRAQERINNERIIDKHARALAKNADDRIANEIDRQNVENERKRADNKIDRKELANKLYQIKEESKRLKKEQRHLSKMQRQEHKIAKLHAYWEAHGETLEQYKMHEGSSLIACNILLWLDGVKSFFLGLSKVSDALVKALKYILIAGAVAGILFAIPVTRNWLLTLLGFTK